MTHIPGILFWYFKPIYMPIAHNLWDSIRALERHSRLPVFVLNLAHPFPPALRQLSFSNLVLHYSLFGLGYRYEIPDPYLEWLTADDSSYRSAYFQDEFRNCGKRFEFINQHRIDTIYTLAPQESSQHGVYRQRTRATHIFPYLTTYVSDHLLLAAARFARPDAERTIDISYRARQMKYFLGRGGQEKHLIGLRFAQLCKEHNVSLKLDIAHDEYSRLHGDRWWRFLGSSRGTLGVESGSGIFDVDDTLQAACTQLENQHPDWEFSTIWEQLLAPYEDAIPYRFLAPRNFEAAAFLVCQVLFEGAYSGILRPNEHYIPLKKDFSNFDQVIATFQNRDARHHLTTTAHRDLIASDQYHYHNHVEQFDHHLEKLGFTPDPQFDPIPIRKALRRRPPGEVAAACLRDLHFLRFPGKGILRYLRNQAKRLASGG